MNLYIVTGGTRGLGRALCEAVARSADNELISIGRAAEGPIPGGANVHADLADTGALMAAFDRLEQRLHDKRYARAILINNAGVVEPVAPLEAANVEDLERNLVVNLVAPLLLMRRFLRATESVA